MMRRAFFSALLVFLFLAEVFAQDVISKPPVWQAGDSWTYRRMTKGRLSFYYSLTFVEKTVFLGRMSYRCEARFFDEHGKLMEDFSKSFMHFSTDLTYLGVEKPDGKPDESTFTPLIVYWPLKEGKEWRIDTYEPWLDYAKVTSLYYVLMEHVSVPAGDFNAFKIVRSYDYGIDRRYQEVYWYSHTVRNFVKKLVVNYDFADELIYFSFVRKMSALR